MHAINALTLLLATALSTATGAAAVATLGGPCAFDANNAVQQDCSADGQHSLICEPDSTWHLSQACVKPSKCPPGGGFCVIPLQFQG
ncbi:uncharacterized protein B0I36DRAFT_363577 [Microdochium trichocladiopsis]|uniref:Uncharacterized protein n=1 Tax=Microdochium trichocladiopsis TaxID=1682393 RepID=A0A9P8Y6H4_9PEZI|nr:uncharacterized protein B0I36DRAFT_363577 [Microdochium trichocladiopsis]KAH7028972.1 hypothetical protein B0I36DRAFT_363577 [Microdochium trichocladiopsis]